MGDSLLARPADEPLPEALAAAVADVYVQPPDAEVPPRWVGRFRALVAAEPALRVEYLKIADASEQALARAIAQRADSDENELRPKALAAIVVGAERAAVLHWIEHTDRSTELMPQISANRLALTSRCAGSVSLRSSSPCPRG